MFLASLTAIIVSGVLLTIIFVIGIITFTICVMSYDNVSISPDTVLAIYTDEIGGDNVGGSAFEHLDLNTMEVNAPISTYATVSSIRAAATDKNIKAIVLVNAPIQNMGLAQMQEVRAALAEFKESGKRVYAYGKLYTNTDYYLASVADEVVMSPKGLFLWNGLSSQYAFFKDMLTKVGVEVTAIKHGKYKSAIEPFTLNGMSDASREQNTVLLNSVWSEMVENISVSREIEKDSLNKYADNLAIEFDITAMKQGFVDTLLYDDQFNDMLKNRYGSSYKLVSFRNYASLVGPVNSKSKDKVAIIYAEGNIIDGESEEGTVGDRSLKELLVKAREDKSVKAVVLRVNSPGGSALAAELICREVELLQKEKPIVASFGNVAASGGYYIAAPADFILASPMTVTGSIGVFGLSVNIEKGLKDKLGIDVDIVKTNTYGDFGTPLRKITKVEEAFMQKSIDNVYVTFVNRVSKGRNLTFEQVDNIAGGRVWSGVDAMKVGLVDGMGGIETAIALAADRAGLKADFEITTLSPKKPLFYELFGVASVGYEWLTNREVAKVAGNSMVSQFNHMTKVVNSNAPQAIMPYMINIE